MQRSWGFFTVFYNAVLSHRLNNEPLDDIVMYYIRPIRLKTTYITDYKRICKGFNPEVINLKTNRISTRSELYTYVCVYK